MDSIPETLSLHFSNHDNERKLQEEVDTSWGKEGTGMAAWEAHA
jgi:hypothetical protein